MESYTESIRFSKHASSSSSSSTNNSHKRRQSTGIMKTNSSASNQQQQLPSASNSPAKKKRRNVSFGGAHVRVFDKANATATIMPSPIQSLDVAEGDEGAMDTSSDSNEGGEVTMDFTRSFTGPIIVASDLHTPLPEAASHTEFEIEPEEVTKEELNQSSSSSSGVGGSDDVTMDFTKSYVFDIIQAGGSELTADLPNYNTMSDKTKEVAAMFRAALQQKDGEDDEEEEEEEEEQKKESRQQPAIVIAADDEEDEEDEVTFKAVEEEAAPSDDITMDLTRSYTSKIITQPQPPVVQEELTQDDSQEECTMDFTRSFTSAITVNPAASRASIAPVVPSAGFLSPLRFPGSSAAMEDDVKQPVQQSPQQPPQPQFDDAPNSDEVTMEFTRSFTSCIQRVTKRASLLPAINNTATIDVTAGKFPSTVKIEEIKPAPVEEVKQQAQIQIQPIKQQQVVAAKPAPAIVAAPAPVAVVAAPAPAPAAAAAAAASSSAPVVAAAASQYAWPPASLQSWLECYFIDAFDMEDVQAACLHLIDSTDSCHELMKKMEEWIVENEAAIQIFHFLRASAPQGGAGANVAAQLRQGVAATVVPEGAPAKLATMCAASVQFSDRAKVESLTVWNEWRYKLGELSYQRLLDAQSLIGKDLATLAAAGQKIEGETKILSDMLSPDARDARIQAEQNALKLLALCRDFAALKKNEAQAQKEYEMKQSNLNKRVLLKKQELAIREAEVEIGSLQSLVGFEPLSLTAESITLSYKRSQFELVVQWNPAGEIETAPMLKNNQKDHGKDAPFLAFVYQQYVEAGLKNVLGALKHRKQLALVLPHVGHLLDRVAHARSELADLHSQFTVRTTAAGLVEVTISRVDTLSQVIVQMHGEELLQKQLAAGGLVKTYGRKIDIVALPVASSLTVQSFNDCMDEAARDSSNGNGSSGWSCGRASRMCKAIHKILGPRERV